MTVIALSLKVSIIASLRYRFEQHTQALSLVIFALLFNALQ
jgi:hypothetical protein